MTALRYWLVFTACGCHRVEPETPDAAPEAAPSAEMDAPSATTLATPDAAVLATPDAAIATAPKKHSIAALRACCTSFDRLEKAPFGHPCNGNTGCGQEGAQFGVLRDECKRLADERAAGGDPKLDSDWDALLSEERIKPTCRAILREYLRGQD
jgi:hypothetical protein